MAHNSPYYRTVKTILATGADQRTADNRQQQRARERDYTLLPA